MAGQGHNPVYGKNSLLGQNTAGTLYHYSGLDNGKLSSRTQASDTGFFGDLPLFGSVSLTDHNDQPVLGISQGTLIDWGNETNNDGWNAYNQITGAGDINGDGRADLVGVNSAGALYRYSGSGKTGTATFKARVQIGNGWNTYVRLF